MTAPIASGRSERGRAGFAPAGKAPTLHGARRTREATLANLLQTQRVLDDVKRMFDLGVTDSISAKKRSRRIRRFLASN